MEVRGGVAVADVVAEVVAQLDAAFDVGSSSASGERRAGRRRRGARHARPRGTLRFSPNLPGAAGRGLAVLVRAASRDATVVIENDANCAALAEHRLGAARGFDQHVVMVTLGTGIGGGLIVDGRVQVGGRGFAGEIGHMVVDPAGPPCPCGRRGCWERYASGGGLGLLAREAAWRGVCPPWSRWPAATPRACGARTSRGGPGRRRGCAAGGRAGRLVGRLRPGQPGLRARPRVLRARGWAGRRRRALARRRPGGLRGTGRGGRDPSADPDGHRARRARRAGRRRGRRAGARSPGMVCGDPHRRRAPDVPGEPGRRARGATQAFAAGVDGVFCYDHIWPLGNPTDRRWLRSRFSARWWPTRRPRPLPAAVRSSGRWWPGWGWSRKRCCWRSSWRWPTWPPAGSSPGSGTGDRLSEATRTGPTASPSPRRPNAGSDMVELARALAGLGSPCGWPGARRPDVEALAAGAALNLWDADPALVVAGPTAPRRWRSPGPGRRLRPNEELEGTVAAVALAPVPPGPSSGGRSTSTRWRPRPKDGGCGWRCGRRCGWRTRSGLRWGGPERGTGS
jgi:hypothetical protein